MGIQPRYTPEFRDQAVKFYASVRDHRSLREVAGELGVHFNTLRRWVNKADQEPGAVPRLTTPEHEELRRLRAENRILQEELEILKKAEAFFAARARRKSRYSRS